MDEQSCCPIVLQTDPRIRIDLNPVLSSTVTRGRHQPPAPRPATAPCPQSRGWKQPGNVVFLCGRGRWKSRQQLLMRANGCQHPVASLQGLFPAAAAGTFFWGFAQPNFRRPKQHILLLQLPRSPGSSPSEYFPASFFTFFHSFFLLLSFCCNTYLPRSPCFFMLF